MKLIIAGSRDLRVPITQIDALVERYLSTHTFMGHRHDVDEVVSGMARGVDQAGTEWARHRRIPVKPFPVTSADWTTKGKSAGPLRNRAMASYADGALIIWDGKSRGSRDMNEAMRALGKPTLFITLGPEEPTPP